jgi:hypothetical protein
LIDWALPGTSSTDVAGTLSVDRRANAHDGNKIGENSSFELVAAIDASVVATWTERHEANAEIDAAIVAVRATSSAML